MQTLPFVFSLHSLLFNITGISVDAGSIQSPTLDSNLKGGDSGIFNDQCSFASSTKAPLLGSIKEGGSIDSTNSVQTVVINSIGTLEDAGGSEYSSNTHESVNKTNRQLQQLAPAALVSPTEYIDQVDNCRIAKKYIDYPELLPRASSGGNTRTPYRRQKRLNEMDCDNNCDTLAQQDEVTKVRRNRNSNNNSNTIDIELLDTTPFLLSRDKLSNPLREENQDNCSESETDDLCSNKNHLLLDSLNDTR